MTKNHFLNSLKFGTIVDNWKKGSVVAVHNKDNKQIINNYRHVFLLSMSYKVFGKLIFDAIFKFMIEINLLSSIPLDFKAIEAATRGIPKKKAFLEISQIFRRPATLLKKRHWHSCFPVNFAKFLRIEQLWTTASKENDYVLINLF